MPTTDPSSYWPPIYRQFLAGDTAQLRLSWSTVTMLVVYAVVLLLAVPAVVPSDAQGLGAVPVWPLLVAVATLQGIVVARLAAHWFRQRVGLLAGVVQLTAACLLPSRLALADALFGLAVAGAMTTFAWGNVPGRLPNGKGRLARGSFFLALGVVVILAGPIGFAYVLAGCLLWMAINQHRGGWGFLADPIGWGVLGLLVAGWLAVGPGQGWSQSWAVESELLRTPVSGCGLVVSGALGSAAIRVGPWLLLALPVVVSGLRQGHYATPIWQFLAGWLLGPLVLTAFGWFRHDVHLGALLPPLSIAVAVGLSRVRPLRLRS